MRVLRIGWTDYLVPRDVSTEELMDALGRLRKLESTYRDGHYFYHQTGDGFMDVLECREVPNRFITTDDEYALVVGANALDNKVRELEREVNNLKGKLEDVRAELDKDEDSTE